MACFLFLSSFSPFQLFGQYSGEQKEIQQTIVNFYQLYFEFQKQKGDIQELFQKQPSAAQYFSKAYLLKLKKVLKAPELDADPFFDAQDAFNQIEVRSIQYETATRVVAQAHGFCSKDFLGIERDLEIRLVQEEGKWKIDRIQGVKGKLTNPRGK